MSKVTEDTQAIADKLARDKYDTDYSDLPKSTQDNLWTMAQEFEQEEIDKLAENRQKEN